MPGKVYFALVLHSHQPVGNFDSVLEQAYRKCYLPFLEEFLRHPRIRVTWHYSGPLLEWIESRHPEYFRMLRMSCDRGCEMLGGGFYEPILTMLPLRDRLGQIDWMRRYIRDRFGQTPRGAWLAERVWEPALVKSLAEAGVEYLSLDDSHFKAAGLSDGQLMSYFVTEDEGVTIKAFPAAEKWRYMIPYATVPEIMEYLESLRPRDDSAIRLTVYADDGEKFGVWPRTHAHVFGEGWLSKWLEAMESAGDWLRFVTLGEAADILPSAGRIYIPEGSYREMTEWALPAERLAKYEESVAKLKEHPAFEGIRGCLRGGSWRSFRVKYPEAGKLYARMMEVSGLAAGLPEKSAAGKEARKRLYRGQCNCPYWHGVFGGLYLPHLRSAVYGELLAAEAAAAGDVGRAKPSAIARDLDFDGMPEIKLSNGILNAYIAPARGGHLYELDERRACVNLSDGLSRRFEAYHARVAGAVVGDAEEARSIHDLVLAKEPGLAEMLKYDAYLRESLVDHVSRIPLTVEDMISGDPPSDIGFRSGPYEIVRAEGFGRKAGNRRGGAVSVTLARTGPCTGGILRVEKTISLGDGNALRTAYRLSSEGGTRLPICFGVEFNYGMLAGAAHDRYYRHERSANAGNMSTAADFGELDHVALVDEWRGISVVLRCRPKARILVHPVRTVSQSEAGFESVYQTSSVTAAYRLELVPGAAAEILLDQEIWLEKSCRPLPEARGEGGGAEGVRRSASRTAKTARHGKRSRSAL
ncbi:MAG: DUF1926 domain-containing protein [Planctomycetota bacterium]|nr:DUF1926 domain-containing protein [Planctomycetota bacterium]